MHARQNKHLSQCAHQRLRVLSWDITKGQLSWSACQTSSGIFNSLKLVIFILQNTTEFLVYQLLLAQANIMSGNQPASKSNSGIKTILGLPNHCYLCDSGPTSVLVSSNSFLMFNFPLSPMINLLTKAFLAPFIIDLLLRALTLWKFPEICKDQGLWYGSSQSSTFASIYFRHTKLFECLQLHQIHETTSAGEGGLARFESAWYVTLSKACLVTLSMMKV